MKRNSLLLVCMIVLAQATNSSAVNDLSVRQDVSHPVVVPGYIDEATIVVEPYGGYSLQSLYIKYTDHGILGGNDVITHAFELPDGAVVNDLWLWIGDSVMQAKIMERRHAQGIWDTVTALKHDPALLKVSDRQFDLSVYPLQSGSFRKVKIQLMVPTHYTGKNPVIMLPYKFLAADHHTATPVKVLFRTLDTKWGIPGIVEDSLLSFTVTVDTLGKRYKVLNIPNVKKYAGLTLTCDGRFANGWTSDFFKTASSTYFSFGMHEPGFFNPPVNCGGIKKSFIGLDLSGRYGVDSASFISNFSVFISKYLHTGDSIRIAVAGEGMIDTLPAQGWYHVDSTTAVTIQSSMRSGRVISSKSHAAKARILFSDGGDGGDLYFSGVEKLADIVTGNSLINNVHNFGQYNIVTTYWHSCSGHEILTSSQLDTLQKALDTFFVKGGIFVEFFAYNRDNNNIARRYFKDLIKPTGFFPGMLHRNIEGPIGHGFPNTIYYDNSAPLQHSDPDADNELFNEGAVPVIISKKIGNGRFILSSMWHKQDNLGIKKVLCTTLLNLQNQSRYYQLPDILKAMVSAYGNQNTTESVIMSNADYLITESNMTNKVDQPTLNAAYEVPFIKTVNLLDGVDYVPPIYNFNGEEFYGSSYCLRTISDRTGGSFYSRHLVTWDYIGQQSAQANRLLHDSSALSVTANGTVFRDSIFDCNADNNFFSDAHFYVGKTLRADTLTFSGTVKYHGLDSIFSRSVAPGFNDSLAPDSTLVSLYRIEILKRMLLAEPFDTNRIIAFAVQNRLLTDVTAFLALEPDDTTHFMKDPKDESDIGPRTGIKALVSMASEEQFQFKKQIVGSQILFTFRATMAGTVVIKIYNLAGREIMSHARAVTSGKSDYITCQSSQFAQGVYIAVARFTPDRSNCSVQRKIERFTVQ
jgi:hypothetical protein